MNRAKHLFLILGLSAPLLVLLGKTIPAKDGVGRVSSARQAALSRPAGIPTKAVPVVSATLGREDTRYKARPSGRGFHATNPRHNLAANFTPTGVTIRSPEAQVKMRLSEYGYGERLQNASAATPRATANRVEYRRGALTEWYVNGPMGLEQGFTLDAPPERPTGEPLQVVLALSGDMIASANKDGKSVSFARSDGRPDLRYTGLLAQDASGRELPAWMELHGDRLILAIADSGASYPVVVDPTFTQTAILTVGPVIFNGMSMGSLGSDVSIDNVGDTVVAIGNAVIGASLTTAVFVFENDTGTINTWKNTLEIPPTGGAASVAISGDGKTIVIGNCANAVCGDPLLSPATAFVYEKPGATWTGAVLAATLSPSDPLVGARFGIAVTIDQFGDTIAVGAPCESTDLNGSSPICGEVHVFVRPGSVWVNPTTETAILSENFSLATNQTQCPGARIYFPEVRTFGIAVSIDSAGDAIMTGAQDNIGCMPTTPGAAYVFLKPSSGPWVTSVAADATLLASNGVSGDGLGISASISEDGSTVAAGANQPGDFLASVGKGAAYVFLRPGAGWSGTLNEAAKLTASDGVNGDQFGFSVSTSHDGSTVVAGSPLAAADSNLAVAYVYLKSGGWSGPRTTEDQKLVPSGGMDINGNTVTPGATFGGSLPNPFLSLSSDATTIASGDSRAQVGSNTNQGAVFLFGAPACSVTLSPSLLAFGTVAEGTSSSAITATLSDCNTALNNIVVSITGANSADFTQTNTCGSSLPANSSCPIDVTFKPSTTATENATLSVSDADSSSPQTAMLTGTGAAGPDFSLVSMSASPPTTAGSTNSATVTAGNSATYVFTLTSLNGFNSVVSLTDQVMLSSPLLTGDTITFDHTSVTPTPAGVTATMTIATTKKTAASGPVASLGRSATGILGGSVPALLVAGVLLGRRLGKCRLVVCALAMALVVIVVVGSGCGGCRQSRIPTGTSPGTYTVTVTGTGGSGTPLMHSATVTLIVQ